MGHLHIFASALFNGRKTFKFQFFPASKTDHNLMIVDMELNIIILHLLCLNWH